MGEALGIERLYTKFDDVLADDDIDFVHINSPIGDHAWMSIAALEAGKHVMCTVPTAIRGPMPRPVPIGPVWGF